MENGRHRHIKREGEGQREMTSKVETVICHSCGSQMDKLNLCSAEIFINIGEKFKWRSPRENAACDSQREITGGDHWGDYRRKITGEKEKSPASDGKVPMPNSIIIFE